jgi:hypothetical protein
MFLKVEKDDVFEGINTSILGKECMYRGISSRIIGMDLQSFAVGLDLVMIEKEFGWNIKDSVFSNLDIIYLEEKPFIWASLSELYIIHETENTPI